MKTPKLNLLGRSIFLGVCLSMLSCLAFAQCPEGNTEVTVTLPNGSQKALCIDQNEAKGLELAPNHSTRSIFSMRCSDSSACSASEYCAKPKGVCDRGTGYCNALPGDDSFCPDIIAQVCGCDNVTYNSACLATKAGVNIVHDGEC